MGDLLSVREEREKMKKRDIEWERIEKEQEVVRDSMKVCGKKRVGGMMRKVCKCWNESIEGKKELFKNFLQTRDRRIYEISIGKRQK